MNDITEKNNIEVATEQADNESTKQQYKMDLASSVVLLAVSLFFLIGGLMMPVEEMTGSAERWFTAPGIFPIFVGGVLTLLSLILLARSIIKTGKIDSNDLSKARNYLKSKHFQRFAFALGLLTIYIVVMIGRVHYAIATFIYLLATMLVFRRKGFKFWKMLIIAILFTLAVTYGFGNLAMIPLP